MEDIAWKTLEYLAMEDTRGHHTTEEDTGGHCPGGYCRTLPGRILPWRTLEDIVTEDTTLPQRTVEDIAPEDTVGCRLEDTERDCPGGHWRALARGQWRTLPQRTLKDIAPEDSRGQWGTVPFDFSPEDARRTAAPKLGSVPFRPPAPTPKTFKPNIPKGYPKRGHWGWRT